MSKHNYRRRSAVGCDAWGNFTLSKILHIGHFGHTTGIFAARSPFKDFFVNDLRGRWACLFNRRVFSLRLFRCVGKWMYSRTYFIHLLKGWLLQEVKRQLNSPQVGHRSSKELKTMPMGRRKSSLLHALIRRETNFRDVKDRKSLLSYAEEISVMSCNRTKVRF